MRQLLIIISILLLFVSLLGAALTAFKVDKQKSLVQEIHPDSTSVVIRNKPSMRQIDSITSEENIRFTSSNK